MFGLKKMTFKGGAHPPEGKEFTEHKPIEIMPSPQQVIIPVQQHIGAPSQVLVQKGDTVKIGDKICEANGFVSLPVHASISGKVTKIGEFQHPLGMKTQAIVIENDGVDTLSDSIQPNENYLNLSPDEMKNRIREAGISGMGGASFPTHVKLSPPKDKPIDTLILNGAECEPYLTADHRLMLEYPDDILKGLQIFQKILNIKRAYIAIENNKPDAIKLVRKKASAYEGISVVGLNVKYPQGAEKQLIYAITKRQVPTGGLPMDVGCLVQNVGTARAVYQAVAENIPLYQRVATITGAGVNETKNILVRIGTLFKDVIEFCGGYKENVSKLIMGGPMMGIAQYTDEVPVIKGTSGILVLDQAATKRNEPLPCISCGRCVDTCPMGLMPTTLAELVDFEHYDQAVILGLMDCIECGTCTFICPSRRNLLQSIRFGKFKVIRQRRKAS